ncbi:MAG: uroporphyrinogen decarboxylase family protein [Candidatus Methylomirabilota bacterium]
MSEIARLLDEYGACCDSAENRRRLSLWTTDHRGLRGETQWHGIPGYTADSGQPMPVTAECLEKMWEPILGMDLTRFYTDPDCYLEYFLRYKLLKFRRLADDTPLTREIPICFGVTNEAAMLGQRVHLLPGMEPQLASEPIVDEHTPLPPRIDFAGATYLAEMAIPFYRRIRLLAGREFRVLFPQWYRGPQGVALYIRGFENFAVDMHENPAFARRLLRYATDAAIQFARWRAEFTGEPIAPCDLFNDDIPLMSPRSYAELFRPCEQILSDFHGGVAYWHSCGDITRHLGEIGRLTGVRLIDFGVSMEDKAEGLRRLAEAGGGTIPCAVEFRVMAQRHIQEASEEAQKAYVRRILAGCRRHRLSRYVLRSSGMSLLLGGEADLASLARWVELVREVQAEAA